MKTVSMVLVLAIVSLKGEEAVLDLTNLHSYADQEVPAYIRKDNTPANNGITDIGATLGRVLFYDKRLSRDGMVSCSSCHQQWKAFGDPEAASTGVAGTTGRHSMRLVNARFGVDPKFFWDERAASLELQTTQPIQDHVEMGFSGQDGDPGLGDLVDRLSEVEFYQVLFTGVYGDAGIDEIRIQRALAQFVRSIQSFDSKYDEGRAQAPDDGAPFPNFTAQENQGKQSFLARPGPGPGGGGAGCAACHQPPEFDIAPNSGHNGVITSLAGGQDLTVTRAPSLRDVVDADGNPHGGFMHDASLESLLDVVNHYNAIPAITPGLDPRLTTPPGPPGSPPPGPQRLNLSETQKNALVAFLQTLTGEEVYHESKWSSPFDEEGNLSLVVLPSEQSISVGTGARRVTVRANGVPNVTYLLKSSSDLRHWSDGIPVIANANGRLIHTREMDPGAGYFKLVYLVPEGE